MKRVFVWAILFLLFCLMDKHEVEAAAATGTVPIAVNDQFINFSEALPLVENSKTYVPVREFSRAVKVDLTVEKPGQIMLQANGKSVILYTAKNEIHFSNGEKQRARLFVENGRTYVPLRTLGEYFGYHVHYMNEGPIVRLVNLKSVLDRPTFLKNNLKNITTFFETARADQRPKVYLTFDDGPNPGIDAILTILKKKQAKASFFMIEPQMRSYPQYVRRLIAEGHFPALHSVTHNRHLLYEGKPSAVVNEMLKTQKTLEELAGFQSMLTRAPYGSKPYMVQSYRDELVHHHFKMWDWDIDSLDWKYRSNPQQIIANVKAGFMREKKENKPIVILFHINNGTIKALPDIIDFLYAQGYQCVAYNPEEHIIVNFWGDKRL
ncbi:polysaccharide deacetylase family protein [Pseudoneobacillus sp. C159]